MRTLLFICSFVLFSQNQFAQNNCVINISADDEVSMHGFSFWPEIKLSSSDTTIYYILHARSPEQITDLKPGVYTAKLTSIFGHEIIKTVDLTKKNVATLAFKGLKKYYKKSPVKESFSSTMKVGDSLFIIHNATAVAIPVIDKIAIVKLNDGYKALRYANLAKTPQIQRKIKNELFLQFRDAESHIRNVTNKNQCTTIETYSFEMSKKIFTINILDCTGIDLSKLIKEAFIEDEE